MSYLFLHSTTNSREEQSMSTKKQSRGRGGGKEGQQRKERGKHIHESVAELQR